jgi:spore germination cell wall hydrolase CwlJ-like protein
MTDMDWPISEDPSTRSADADARRGKTPDLLLRHDESGFEAEYILAERRSRGRRRPQRLTRRRAGLYLGAGVLALVVVGAVARMTQRGGSSVTEPLPPAAATAAASPVLNLPPPNLLKPISPEEAAKENAERPFVNRTDTPAARFVLRTDPQDRERALNCLTQAVYYEAAGEGVDGGRAVAQVVLNRMRHPGYPASVCGVVYQGAERPYACQFTFACDGSLLRVPAASLWARSRKIAEDALAGKVFAPIGHATHYHADYVLPYWADSLDKSVQVGRHIFYRLRGSLGDSRSFFQRYAGSEPELPKPDLAVVTTVPDPAAQLASALVSDEVKSSTPDVEKAASVSSALLADAAAAKLIADDVAPEIPSRKRKTAGDCSAPRDGKKLMPLRSTDMSASAAASGC